MTDETDNVEWLRTEAHNMLAAGHNETADAFSSCAAELQQLRAEREGKKAPPEPECDYCGGLRFDDFDGAKPCPNCNADGAKPMDSAANDYEVTCARCGHRLMASTAIPEEGDEWECRPCADTHDKLEALRTRIAALEAERDAATKELEIRTRSANESAFKVDAMRIEHSSALEARDRLEWIPEHKASALLSHNEHLSSYETVEQYLVGIGLDADEWAAPGECEKAIETNELWVLQWYPATPIGFCRLAASSPEALIARAAAMQRGGI